MLCPPICVGDQHPFCITILSNQLLSTRNGIAGRTRQKVIPHFPHYPYFVNFLRRNGKCELPIIRPAPRLVTLFIIFAGFLKSRSAFIITEMDSRHRKILTITHYSPLGKTLFGRLPCPKLRWHVQPGCADIHDPQNAGK